MLIPKRPAIFCGVNRLFCKKVSVASKTESVSHEEGDLIGPPHSVSNLRPVVFYKPINESQLQRKYRKTRAETQLWNQDFWINHNLRFAKERKKFQDTLRSQGKEILSADDMSVFYKKFLDENWKNHYRYNAEWYRRNIYILFLEMRIRLKKLFRLN